METVNLLLPLTLTLLLCFSPAAGIKCYWCFGQKCATSGPEERNCGPKEMCMANTVHVKGQAPEVQTSCASPEFCPSPGTRSYSITTSTFSVQTQVTCCNSDLCNTQAKAQPVPALTPGPLKCPICNPNEKNCNPVQCNQLEDRCFKTEDHVGCTTANNCAAKEMNSFMFYMHTREIQQISMTCNAPPLHCQLCLDPCCSKIIPFSAPSGSKCVAARVKDFSGSVTVRKAIASAPLCSLNLTKAFAVDETEVQVTCCDTDHCNTEVPEFQVSVSPEPVSPCHGPGCTDGLYDQLHKLIQGVSVVTGTCSTNSEVVP